MHDLLILLGRDGCNFRGCGVCSCHTRGRTNRVLDTDCAGLLAFLIGVPAITHDDAGPPAVGDGVARSIPTRPQATPVPSSTLAYVFGCWVYDSLHKSAESNELHPAHSMIKIGQAAQGDLSAGLWPPDLGTVQLKYDAQFGVINSPGTIEIQK